MEYYIPFSLLRGLLPMLQGLPDHPLPTVLSHYLMCTTPLEHFRLLD